METRILFQTARSAVLEIADGGIYETRRTYTVMLNGQEALPTNRVITNLFGLKPDTAYQVSVRDETGAELSACGFHTDYESATLNVRDFGAAGDGVQDDTVFLQTAIAACPPEGRVLVPRGVYKFRCLTLKSDLRLCLERGAVLSAFAEPDRVPLLPGVIQTWDEAGEINLGTWEGNPLESRTGLISGFGVSGVVLYGEGVIDGCATREDWWSRELEKALPARPRLLFLNRCQDVTLQGLLFRNSPAWTLHPYFSDHLAFYGTQVENPADSPNTDGLDPESCQDVQIIGMRFSLGDDCIAVKSGKVYMARKYRTPTRDLTVRQCLLENGHGAVTVGSEMAGGVVGMRVEDCIFRNTDRGLRIKTRRGRGRQAVIDGITFRNIHMDQVMTPLVINCFYYCDPDGHTSYVQSREPLPADERTPELRGLIFENLICENCHVRAAHMEGLPEKRIQSVTLKNVHFRFADHPKSGVAAMSEGVEPCAGRGILASNVERLVLENVTVQGQQGEALELSGIGELIQTGGELA